MRRYFLLLLILSLTAQVLPKALGQDVAAGQRPRAIVSTDIGGTDPDDLQSMVHFLLYADKFDVEALVSSPYGPGRREHILQVIDYYERDYANLRTHSPRYPTPGALRAIAWEGAIESAGPAGFDKPTDGSRRIIEAARRADPRPLYVLVWGGIDDLADPAAAEGVHAGAKHVSRWREEFLRDFAARLSRTVSPAEAQGAGASALPATIRWGADVLRQKPDWYASRDAKAIADSVRQYQAADGGWPKNTDLGVPPPSAESRAGAGADVTSSTIDNNGTTMPMQFLALVAHATGDARYRASFLRGFDYLLAAQYPNGGWPQFFPLRQGYYTRITFNDNAMVNVLTLLRDAATGKAPYAFVDETRRTKARAAVSRGIDIILKTQVKQNGKLTAWCAQHDEKTLAPAWARAYEPPSLSGSESVGIVRFLMEIERPAPEIVAAIEAATAWLKSVAIPGLRLETFTGADGRRDRRVVPDPSAGPLWARFYELGTNRPIFLGRDSVVRSALSEIEYERRNGYAYYGTWPASLLDTEFPRWREKNSR